jgi:YidC/Oxa1 family membrane protein insertase
MDNARMFLLLALGLVLMLLYQAWIKDYGASGQPPVADGAPTGTSRPAVDPASVPGDVPPATPNGVSEALPVQQQRLPGGETVRVVTDLLEVHISTRGGDVRALDLVAYPVSLDRPETPYRLLDDSSRLLFVAQSGLLGGEGALPDHHAQYSTEQAEYRLADGLDSLVVPLRWNEGGLQVEKRFIFKRNSYRVDIEFVVSNQGSEPRVFSQYRQLQRTPATETSRFMYTYTGGVIYSPENKYEKIDFDSMVDKPLNREFANGWAAMIQHYFLAAWVPAASETSRYYSKALAGERYLIGMVSPAVQVAPGASVRLGSQLYAGPKEQERLKATAPGLELTVDYGMLTFIAQPIYWLMDKIHDLIGNWGWTIILLTVLIKLAFYKLSETSYRSMAKMRQLQPRLTALRERYGDDKQRMQQAMMEMYKKDKINPLGGCLPILVQIPVFIALYWVLLESVELRQAPFMFWIKDLSDKDPYYVLPILMGASMFVQQRLNPTPPDPMQARIMMLLPFVFTVMFLFFPSGLVLYWVVNNLLSISQQWVITRRIEQAAASK